MLLIREKNHPLRGLFIVSTIVSLVITSMALSSFLRYGMELPLLFYCPILFTLILLPLNKVHVEEGEMVRFGKVKLFIFQKQRD